MMVPKERQTISGQVKRHPDPLLLFPFVQGTNAKYFRVLKECIFKKNKFLPRSPYKLLDLLESDPS